jgi:hypothetical protein
MNKAILAALLLLTFQDTPRPHKPSVYFRPRSAPTAPAPPAIAPVVLGQGSDQTLIVDEFGNIEVGWYSVDTASGFSGFTFTESMNQGLSWSAPALLPVPASIPMNPLGPTMAIEHSGVIDVVYLCGPDVCVLASESVQLVRSVDNGATWSAPIQISLPPHLSGSGANEPVIAACGAGVVIAWQDDGVGVNYTQVNPDIMLVYVVGGVPQTPIDLSNTTASEGHPQIVVTPQSSVYVTWVTDNGQGGGFATDSILFASVPNCGQKN